MTTQHRDFNQAVEAVRIDEPVACVENQTDQSDKFQDLIKIDLDILKDIAEANGSTFEYKILGHKFLVGDGKIIVETSVDFEEERHVYEIDPDTGDLVYVEGSSEIDAELEDSQDEKEDRKRAGDAVLAQIMESDQLLSMEDAFFLAGVNGRTYRGTLYNGTNFKIGDGAICMFDPAGDYEIYARDTKDRIVIVGGTTEFAQKEIALREEAGAQTYDLQSNPA